MTDETVATKAPEQIFNEQMSAVQAALGRISTDASNPMTNSKYATYAKLDSVIRPIYVTHGFSLIFSTVDCPLPDHIRVTCRVACGGHKETYQLDVPCDGLGMKGTPSMTKTHALGSATRYGMRYLLAMIFNIAIDKDDDGNAASQQTEAAQWKNKTVRKHYVVELQRRWGANDAPGLRQLWDELDNEQRLDIWSEFNSKQRSEMKTMLSSTTEERQ